MLKRRADRVCGRRVQGAGGLYGVRVAGRGREVWVNVIVCSYPPPAGG